ncbi:SGNH/GDSL hydrolase family protein [Pseudomonas oryzihabitans]|uniref:SGNH/GDSL hydrolase family protein n=1 Tax=Pseudomonas oryzihabitans TaxID=47885 RepID=UPI00241E6CB1|nr:SGNH/GDSL hydrolase family protein [Pseudomonas oryzihabitans]
MGYPRRIPRVLGAFYDQLEQQERLAGLMTTGTTMLTKHLFGRMRTQDAANAITFNMQIELESPFMAFRIGIPNIHTAPVTGVKACVGLSAAAPAANYVVQVTPEGGEWIDCTFNGAATVDLLARAGEERYSMAWSDLIYLPSVARTDVTTGRPIVMVRIEFPAGSKLTTPFNDLYYWRTNGPRIYCCSSQEVQGVTTKTSFTQNNVYSSGGDAKAVVPAIQYISQARGHQVMIMGDSISEGLGGTVRDYGALQRAVCEVSTAARPVEYFNAALHAQAPEVFSRMLDDHVERIRPTVLFYAPWSVNDVAAGGITTAALRRAKGNLARVMATLQSKGVRPLVVLPEALPCNTAYRSVGANDSIRRDFNTTFLPSLSGAMVLSGYAAAFTGTRTDGQDQIKAGSSDDGVHPNEAGHDLLKVPPKTLLQLLLDRVA